MHQYSCMPYYAPLAHGAGGGEIELFSELVIWLKARFISDAKPRIVVTAAKTTNAMIRAYSTKPWPEMSWWRRAAILRARFTMERNLLVVLFLLPLGSRTVPL